VKDYKNYIPPGGRSPWKNEGGPIPIKQVLLQCSKNRGGGGDLINIELPGESTYLLRENRMSLCRKW